MQFTQAAVLAFLAVGASAGQQPQHTPAPNATWVTTTVTGYVTYCPKSTTFTGPAHKVYTATASQWVTVTDCPCTISFQPGPAATICPLNNGTVARFNGTHGNFTAPAAPTRSAICISGQCTSGSSSSSSSNSNSGSSSSSSSNSNSGSSSSSSSNSNSGSSSSGSSNSGAPGNAGANTPAQFQGAASKVTGCSAALAVVIGAVTYFL